MDSALEIPSKPYDGPAKVHENCSFKFIVPYTNTDAETSKAKRTKFSDRFCKSGRSVACVMKVFHVVASLNHLSRKEVGHLLPPPPHVINLLRSTKENAS